MHLKLMDVDKRLLLKTFQNVKYETFNFEIGIE